VSEADGGPGPEPLVLGVDTSTSVNVGLARGAEVLARGTVTDAMAHVEQLTPLIEQCLAEARLTPHDLSVLVVGLGPGPFTGLRVGIVTARVLASALGLRLHGVCSLDVIARQHALTSPVTEFLVATDARRREVYWARYSVAGHRLFGPAVGSPDDLPRLPTIGPAADLYADRLVSAAGPRALDAGMLATQGLTLPSAGHEPLYLRRPDAMEPSRRKSVLHHHDTHGYPRGSAR
jgi:tRNA threonylcarbamoyl adenosine modification protein YeaZ